MDSMASLRLLQPHKLTSIQISAETTVYTSLDSSLAALQRQKPPAEEDGANSNSLPPAVELLLSAAASAVASSSSESDVAAEKVAKPELEKEERAKESKNESSLDASPKLQKQLDQQQPHDEEQVVSDSSRSSVAQVEGSAVALASNSSVEAVHEKPSLPVINEQESHVVRIQIVQKEDNNNNNNNRIDSPVNFMTTTSSGTAVINVTNSSSAIVVNNQCKAKVSIVSFGPPPDQEVSISPTPSTEMVQKQASSPSASPTAKAGDLDVNSATYLYYMMSSGQCSPSDTLDSGTCSDIEVTPPPLPKKLSKSPQPQKQHATTTLTVTNGRSPTPVDKPNQADGGCGGYRHQRVGSSSYNTSDSDESESSLSCDSLNFAKLCGNVGALKIGETLPVGPDSETRTPELSHSISDSEHDNGSLVSTMKKQNIVSILPDSLLKDIRERSIGAGSGRVSAGSGNVRSFSPPPREEIVTTTRTILMEKINSLNSVHSAGGATNSANSVFSSSPSAMPSAGNKSLSFENDKFYKFHINEHSNLPPERGSTSNGHGNSCSSSVIDDDESFAGFKDLTSGTSTIRSNKGTVRGVKNRVRNGIATFLQMQQANIKNYKEKDAGKVVVYTTSMGIVRETYTKCANVKQILRTLLVKFEERDVFMSNDYQQEIKERMQNESINVPQVFVDGQHVGDADCIERLNESGELRKMLKPYKCLESSFTCKTCGGYRLLPCPSCGGSKKSIHRNHFTAEFIALKCMNCDEVGLVKCHSC